VTSVAIVGGGFGGIGAAAMLRRAGHPDATVFERAERVGGVWQHNTYPGAACDIPSHLYVFSFAPNPRWSRRFAPGAEIQAYLEEIARPLDVRTSTDVRSARFAGGRWTLQTSAGEFGADVLIAACGQLSTPSVPALPGLDDFAGPAFHTARWRHDVDLAGRRVAVIGTGCSAIQVVPAIAGTAARVDVYQRSPGWTIPKLDFAYSERAKRAFERFPALQQLDRASAMHEHGACQDESPRPDSRRSRDVRRGSGPEAVPGAPADEVAVQAQRRRIRGDVRSGAQLPRAARRGGRGAGSRNPDCTGLGGWHPQVAARDGRQQIPTCSRFMRRSPTSSRSSSTSRFPRSSKTKFQKLEAT
jgi:cation diffusion facilitator CzcD-associated flavoprotein CzcO